MTPAELALIEWARAERAVRESLRAWLAAIGDEPSPATQEAWAACERTQAATRTALHRLLRLAEDLLAGQSPDGIAHAGAEFQE